MSIQSASEFKEQKNKVVIKVGLLGDSDIGKATLMVKLVGGKFEDLIETLGVNFMEKTIHLKNVDVTISIWDLGGQREFGTLMPLVCSDAKVILFAFDLTQKTSLLSVKRWYKEARKENKQFIPFLVGTKFDLFDEMLDHHKMEITNRARKFAMKMHAPLIYCSSTHSINVKKILKLIIAKVFDLKPKMKELHNCNKHGLIEFDVVYASFVQKRKNKSKKKRKKKRRKKKRKKKKGSSNENKVNNEEEDDSDEESVAKDVESYLNDDEESVEKDEESDENDDESVEKDDEVSYGNDNEN